MQFQSDILNVPVERPKMLEVTALGVAFLAGIKAGIWKLDSLSKIRKVETFFQPKMTNLERDKKYSGWQDAIKRTKSKF